MPGLKTSFQELFAKWFGNQEMETLLPGEEFRHGIQLPAQQGSLLTEDLPSPLSSMNDQGFPNKNVPRDLLGTADTAGPGLAPPASPPRTLMLLVCGPNLESQEASTLASPQTELLKIQKLDFPGGSGVRSQPANVGGMEAHTP